MKQFITKEELDKVLNKDIDTLNEVFSRLYNKIVEDVYLNIPSVINQVVKQSVGIQEITDKWMTKNSSFKEHVDILPMILQDVELENPDKTYEQILELATPIIEQRINSIKRGTTPMSMGKIPKLILEEGDTDA